MNDKLESAVWFKASHSNGQAECVEVAILAGVVGARDTKDRGRATLCFPRQQWQEFVAGAGEGRFDRA